LTRLVVVAVAFVIAANLFRHNFGIVAGSVSHHWVNYVIAAVAFGILNLTVGVVLRLITLPLRILTFGLFSIVINAILILILSALPASTHVRLHTNAVGALEAALVIAVVSVLAELAGVGRKRR
jgi:putative membrane protein